MRFFTRLVSRGVPPLAVLALATLCAPASASAQYSAPDMGDSSAVGEKYHVEACAARCGIPSSAA